MTQPTGKLRNSQVSQNHFNLYTVRIGKSEVLAAMLLKTEVF
jgi:hypothetical protein